MRHKKVLELRRRYETLLREQNEGKEVKNSFDKGVFRRIKKYWKKYKILI